MRKNRVRHGAALIMMLLLMSTFIGVAAISLDMGRMYLFRTQVHLATDAGALAGAQRLMRNDKTTADDSAVAITQQHLVGKTVPTIGLSDVVPGFWNSTNSTFTPAAGGDWFAATNNAVQVSASYNAPFTFGRYFGLTTRLRNATSIAAVGSVGPSDCIKPWAVPYERMLLQLYPSSAPGNPYDTMYNLTQSDVATLNSYTSANNIFLKVGNPSQTVFSGNFYAVREPPLLYANGTTGNPWAPGQNYRDAISAPCDHPLMQHAIGPGDWLQADQGNATGPTKQGTADLCGVPPSANFTCSPEVPIKMAMWDTESSSPSANGVTVNCAPRCFHVKFIGVFVVTGYVTTSGQNPDEGVQGYFSTLVSAGGFTTNPSPLKKIALVY